MKVLQKIRSLYSEIEAGIQNLIKWFPVIWKDRDFDHAFIEYLLQHKLQAIYNRFNDSDQTYVNWEAEESAKALKALRICLTILERRRSEFYIDLWDSDHEELSNELLVQMESVENRDWKLLWRLMDNHMLWWWD
tara:strand:- start:189 stop:593 length:405 start_codon:yes stop_codon:yes gene_type:complete